MDAKIRFPALDISVDDWDRDAGKDDVPEIYFKDGYFHHSKESFDKYTSGHMAVDSNGGIYKITGIKKLETFASHLPLTAKFELVFEPTGERMTFEEVKNYMLEKIMNIEDKFDDYKSDWIKSVESVDTIEDLILT